MRTSGDLSLDISDLSLGSPTKWMEKLGETPGHPAGLREFSDYGSGVSIPGQADWSLDCVSPCFWAPGPPVRAQRGFLLPTFGTPCPEAEFLFSGWVDPSHMIG